MTLSNWVSWQLLRKFQIPVDMLVGESMGDIPALCAAGGADFHRLAPALWKALNIEGRAINDGLLAFAAAPAKQVEPILAQTGTHVAAYQTPGSVIFGGAAQECSGRWWNSAGATSSSTRYPTRPSTHPP